MSRRVLKSIALAALVAVAFAVTSGLAQASAVWGS